MNSRKFLIRRIIVIILALAVVGAGVFYLATSRNSTPSSDNPLYSVALAIEDESVVDITNIMDSPLGIVYVYAYVPGEQTPEDMGAAIQSIVTRVTDHYTNFSALYLYLMGERTTYALDGAEQSSVAIIWQVQILGTVAQAYTNGTMTWDELTARVMIQNGIWFIKDSTALEWPGR